MRAGRKDRGGAGKRDVADKEGGTGIGRRNADPWGPQANLGRFWLAGSL